MTRVPAAIAVVAMLVTAACAPQRRVDPTEIGLPAAERLTDAQILEIVEASSRYHARGFSLLADRSSVEEVREMASEVLRAEEELTRERAMLAGPREPHHLAASVLDREAALTSAIPVGASPDQTAAFLRQLAEQDRWLVILIDNSLARSARSEGVRAHIGATRQHAVANLTRLRTVRARL